jgi:hypothetical protein
MPGLAGQRPPVFVPPRRSIYGNSRYLIAMIQPYHKYSVASFPVAQIHLYRVQVAQLLLSHRNTADSVGCEEHSVVSKAYILPASVWSAIEILLMPLAASSTALCLRRTSCLLRFGPPQIYCLCRWLLAAQRLCLRSTSCLLEFDSQLDLGWTGRKSSVV